jgi:hypothetical protein
MQLTELLAKEGVEWRDATHRHGRAGWVQVDCPKCGPGSMRFHCGLSLRMPVANCWRCGRLVFWDVLRGYVQPHLLRQLQHGSKAKALAFDVVPGGVYTPPKGVGPLGPAHVAYLRGRGFDPDAMAALWGAGGISLHTLLPWRVFIPIYYQGKPVSWTTRTIGPAEKKKYISAALHEEALPHKQLLYGVDYCRSGVVVVHEGPLDVWRTGPGAVCTFGTHYTPQQVAMLTQFHRRVVCFDPTPEAQARADVLCDMLAIWPGETVRVVPDAEDPGSATPVQVRELRDFAGLDL